MAMTMPDVFDAIVARLAAVGLKEATSPVGVTNQPSPVIDRSFSVSWEGEQDTGQTRSRTDRGAMRMQAFVTVQLVNKNPIQGQQVLRAALEDTQLAIRAAWKAATELTKNVHVTLRGRTTRALTGGGAYYLTTIPLTFEFHLDLDLEATP